MKWEALPLADRAKLMAAAVRNGYTDIRSIKAAYANFQNQKQLTGNRYAEGGGIDNNDVEVVNVLDEHPVWKALGNIDYETVADPEFTREKTGLGSIEYFSAEEPEGITYTNGYHRDHPMPGKDVILYNPDENDEQDIRLDALHIMPKDPTYDALNTIYRNASWDARDDNYINAKDRYTTDKVKQAVRYVTDKATGKNINERYYGTDPFIQYFNNEADGTLRSLLMEGDENYRASKRYWKNKDEVKEWNAHLMPYVNDIQQYLETGERPADILPELVVTDKKAYGGNLYQTGGNKKSKKKSWQQELQERKNYYRQQLILRGLRGAQLEAVLANMEVESKFDPGAHNDASGARGLMQWLGSRKPKSWSEKDQLDYIAATYNKFGGNEWLDKAAWKRFNETTDPAEAARLFRRYWERPEKSSWYATDALFKNNGSYLPKEVNDVVKKVASLEYNGPKEFKGPIFTDADQRLLDTPLLAFHNPQYDNYESPDYQESPLMLSIKLNPAYDDSDNPFALYSMLASMQQESALNNPYSWLSALMTVSPKTTPEQKQTANWLFAPQSSDYMYHGLNFAAYGGPLARIANNHLLPFGGYTNAINAINQTGEGYHYIIDGQTMNRQQALDYINKHKNETYAVNRYSTTSSTAGKQNEELNWQTLGANGKWIDNNEYHPDEGLLDEVVITHPYTVNNALSQDRIYLQHNPIADLTVTPTIDLTNTDQNMFHRRNVTNADASVRESMSSDVVDNIYDYMMPSTWAGLADKALEGGYNFNQLFNPTYDNQGWIGLFGADQWAKLHPEEAFAINFGTDLVLPFGIKGVRRVGTAARNAATWEPVIRLNSSAKTIPNHNLMGVKLSPSINKITDSLHNLRSELNDYLTADNNLYRELIFMKHHPKLTRFINELSLGDKAAGLYAPGKNSQEFINFYKNKIQEANPNAKIPEFSTLKELSDWEENMALEVNPSINYTGDYAAYKQFLEQYRNDGLKIIEDIFGGKNPYIEGMKEVESRLLNGGNERIQKLTEQNSKLRNKIVQDANSKGLFKEETDEILKQLGLSIDLYPVLDRAGNVMYDVNVPHITNSRITPYTLPLKTNTSTGFKFDDYMSLTPDGTHYHMPFEGSSIQVNPVDDIGIVFSKKHAYDRLFDIGAHEYVHAKYPSVESYANWLDESIFPNTNKYFSVSGATEIAARGSQIKNILKRNGMWKDGQKVTAKMLKQIKNSVIRTGDNNMTEFFSKIKDWDAAADWITKYAPSIAIPTGMSYGVTQSN